VPVVTLRIDAVPMPAAASLRRAPGDAHQQQPSESHVGGALGTLAFRVGRRVPAASLRPRSFSEHLIQRPIELRTPQRVSGAEPRRRLRNRERCAGPTNHRFLSGGAAACTRITPSDCGSNPLSGFHRDRAGFSRR
jgi:hypothetical protein